MTRSIEILFNAKGQELKQLREMDGLKYARNKIPHPTLLGEWSDRGYYTIDVENDCFRLTEEGRAEVKRREEEAKNATQNWG